MSISSPLNEPEHHLIAMSPPPPSPLAANAVVPTNGGLYVVEAIGYNHWLNLAYSGTFDGEVILAYGPDTSDPTPATNMVVSAWPSPVV